MKSEQLGSVRLGSARLPLGPARAGPVAFAALRKAVAGVVSGADRRYRRALTFTREAVREGMMMSA